MIAESAALGGEAPPSPAPCAVMPDVRRDGSYRKSKRQRNMPSEQKVRQEPELRTAVSRGGVAKVVKTFDFCGVPADEAGVLETLDEFRSGA